MHRNYIEAAVGNENQRSQATTNSVLTEICMKNVKEKEKSCK